MIAKREYFLLVRHSNYSVLDRKHIILYVIAEYVLYKKVVYVQYLSN